MPKLLSTNQAVFIGLASMLGAGVFSIFGPTAQFAGSWLPVAVCLAAIVAYLNAMSISQLAAVVTRSGGAYAYGRHYLSNTAGFIAGSSFLVGKLGSIAAIALTFANYLTPQSPQLTAVIALLLMTLINIAGVNRTALGAKLLASVTIGFFVLIILVAGFNGQDYLIPLSEPTGFGVFTAAAMFFFAFAGYARVATLGGEVSEPAKAIPRAIKISLSVVLGIYLSLAFLLQSRLGATLPESDTAIKDLVALALPGYSGSVWVFAAIAALGSLLALLAGMGRTMATMAEDGELPKVLAIRNNRNAPWVAELLLALLGVLLILSSSYLMVVGISSFAVLSYYAIAQCAAIRQPKSLSQRSKFWNWLGLAGCLGLAFSIPITTISVALAVLVGLLILRAGLAKVGFRH